MIVGDGRADLIWTDKIGGDSTVSYNLGMKTEADRPSLSGSLFDWAKGVKVFDGDSRGTNMFFPNLGGQGRADLVVTHPVTAQVSTPREFILF